MISTSQRFKPDAFQDSIHTLIECAPGIIYKIDSDSDRQFVFLSKSVREVLGYSEKDFYCEGGYEYFLSLIHPNDIAAFESKFIKGTTSEVRKAKYRIHDKDGKIKWIKDTFISKCDDSGVVHAVEGILTHETSKLNYRDLLYKFKAYRAAIDVSIISSITDVKGTILHVNRNFCRASKYAKSELIGKNHNIVNSGFHGKEFFADMWKTILSGRAWYGEVLNRAKDGSLYWVDTVIIPVFNDAGSITQFLSLRILINGRKDAEYDFAQYAHALEEISFMVSHKLRGPLCSLLGLLYLFSKEQNTSSLDNSFFTHFKTSLEKLESITKELSTFVYNNEIELKCNSRFNDPYTRHSIETKSFIYKENNYA